MKSLRRAISGVLLLDKPEGLSSNSAVGWAKRLFNADKAGHTGTLDPFATGLLPICFGEATKFSRFMLDADKGYLATLKLGEVSSTGDTEGDIIQRCDVNVDETLLSRTLATFLGKQTQVPPMHSALKRDGVPLYKLARQGVEVERVPREITVQDIAIVKLMGDVLILNVSVSKGTYIRVLAQDIGAALGCGAHLRGLRRTATGGFSVVNAVSFDMLEALSLDQRDTVLQPAESLSMALPAIFLDTHTAQAVQNGQRPSYPANLVSGAEYRAYAGVLGEARFLGIVQAGDAGEATSLLTAVRLMAPGSDTETT